jgi:hypothetical protein
MMKPSTSRLSTLAEMMSWQIRGIVASDTLRPYMFALRDLAQQKEVAARTKWAATIAGEPRSATLDTSVGFATDPFAGVIDLSAVCRLGQELARKAGENGTAGGKAFHVNQMLPSDPAAIETMLAVALHPEVLRCVTAYLGVVPVLGDMDFFCSLPTPDGKAFSKSQLYHCDDTSLTQVKFFVYADEVGEHDGPLQAIDKQRSQRVRDLVGYRYGGRASRVSDATMDAHVPAGDQHSFVGPGGTSMLVDTARCFHRGSRIRHADRRRMVAVFQYVPPNCTQLPLRLTSGAPYLKLATHGMSPLARAVLGEPATAQHDHDHTA